MNPNCRISVAVALKSVICLRRSSILDTVTGQASLHSVVLTRSELDGQPAAEDNDGDATCFGDGAWDAWSDFSLFFFDENFERKLRTEWDELFEEADDVGRDGTSSIAGVRVGNWMEEVD